jgi:hypothetical protein
MTHLIWCRLVSVNFYRCSSPIYPRRGVPQDAQAKVGNICYLGVGEEPERVRSAGHMPLI